MIPLRLTALCTAGILIGFAAGWYFKPVPVPGTAGQGADGAHRRTGLPTSLAGRPVGAAGETWLDAAAADAVAVRSAAQPGEADPVAGAGLIGSFTDTEAKEHFISSLLNEWLSKDAASVGEWLDRNRASSSFDAMAFLLARHISKEDPEAARRWAAQISDPGWRERLETQLSWDQGN